MTDFTQFKNKSGKCSNFGNCSLADARTTVQVPTGMEFVCTECGKPLLMTDGGDAGGGSQSKTMLLAAGVLVAMLAAGAGAWVLLRGDPTPPAPPPVEVSAPPAPAPASAPVTAPTAAPAPAPAPLPATGHCSDADAQAGLCQKR